MTIHIGGERGDIAETVLMPGDPLRAKYIAENFLENVTCYSEIRGMYGFTGEYKGKRISIQGSGMGIPSISIYANELVMEYGVKNIIRIGSCGAFPKEVKLLDVILAQGASTDSNINNVNFRGGNFSCIASFDLLQRAYASAQSKGIRTHVGNVLSTDIFYADEDSYWDVWKRHGILAVEMETAALYTIAAKNPGVNALGILTVSDHFATGEKSTAKERETTFSNMIEIAMELA
jgi:purine-nucleoside phosphorylase